jgi:c(7)-type cytochrome triheme protein
MGIAALCALLGVASPPAGARLHAAQISPEPAAANDRADAPPAPAPVPAEELRSPLYDRSNADLERLQTPREAMQGLPRDADGKVEWMTALRKGAITPRGKLGTADGDHLAIDLDVIMRNTKQMPYVRFPHRAHTEWLACSNCHPALFEARAGSTQIKMEDIFRGRFCGTCHDRVAFITHRNCYRCHSVPQPNAPAAY